MNHHQRLTWLREADPARLELLWQQADDARRAGVGDEVHLRGLIELSNHCARHCLYCGIRADQRGLPRYRMTADEVLDAARRAKSLGCGTVVMQAGEDAGLDTAFVSELVRMIKRETGLAVTLSLGEREPAELEAWRRAGADRYLIRFETSNRRLFEAIHPPRSNHTCDRIALLRMLRELGYEVGSGVMIGIPGQSHDDVANDLGLFRDLDLDMIGVGPFIPHPDTPLARGAGPAPLASDRQVPNDELTACKVVALARLMCPRANIPSTTALATISREHGQLLGLRRGANVVMPNVTPAHYRKMYEIYPGKACFCEDPAATVAALREQLAAVGRSIATGPGPSPNWRQRQQARSAEYERRPA